MKKSIKLLSLLLTGAMSLFCALSLTACFGDYSDSLLSADIFKGYKVDFSNATAIGISEKSGGNAKTLASTKNALALVGTQQNLAESNKNKLIIIDAQNIAREVIFQQINGGGEMAQDDINAEVDKVYVTDDFVYFSLTTLIIDRSAADVNYDQTDYKSDGYCQSFVVDRATDKVYSLAELSHIYFVENNIVQADKTFYALSIVGENAVFTDLVLNKDTIVGHAYMDKDGMFFVDNNAVDQTTDNVVYVTSGFNTTPDSFTSGLGSDGRFYRFKKQDHLHDNAKIHVFDSSIKDWVEPIFDDTLVINHNEYFYHSLSSYGSWSYNHYTFINGSHSYTESFFAPEDKDITKNVRILGTNIFKLESGSIKMYAFDDYNGNVAEWLPTTVATPNGVTLNKFDDVKNNVIYATGYTATTTSTYQIYIDGGTPKCELLSYAEYNANIIILQPLN